jgi:hypothetical protein
MRVKTEILFVRSRQICSSFFCRWRQSQCVIWGALLLLAGSGSNVGGGTLSGTFNTVAAGSNVNLTEAGKLDWQHWGLYTDSSVNRKAGIATLISDYQLLGNPSNDFLAAYQFTNAPHSYTWHDGAPKPTITNTTTGVWAYGYPSALGSGFRFTVPADTTTKTLQVFVGAFNGKGQFTASLSDGSATNFLNGLNATVNNHGDGPGGVFTLTFAADSTNQLLTVDWTLETPYGADANVTLQAAALTAPDANNPPLASITSPTNDTAVPAQSGLTLFATAQDFDGTVTNVAFYANNTELGQAASSPYTCNWNNIAAGEYLVTAVATDNLGRSRPSAPVEVFAYTGGGVLSGSVDMPPASVDLTMEGTADWVHWGLTDASSFDYKNLVSRKISNFTVLGTNSIQNYANNLTAFSWSDGVPNLEVNGSTTGVFIKGLNHGFTLTALADTNSRTLRVYVGLYGAQARFRAYLSDLSAAPFTDTNLSNIYNDSFAVYTLNYSAAAPAQTLNVVFEATTLFDVDFGNLTLQAATLQGGPSDPLPVLLLNRALSGNDFSFAFQSQSNRNYAIQFADSLPPPSWVTLVTVPGTGGIINVTNATVNNGPGFYRVLTE